MLENTYRKTSGPFRLMMVLKIHTLCQEDSALRASETKVPILQREGNMQRTFGRMGPAFPGQGRTEESAAAASDPTHGLDSR